MCFTTIQRVPANPASKCPATGHSAPPRSLVIFGCATILALAGCARADNPELFQADPALLNDFTESLPPYGSTGGFDYAIIQGQAIFEGDIILGQVDKTGSIPQKMRSRGLARSDAFGRWPDGIVPYLAPTVNSPIQQKNIELAIEHWMERTRITFVERTEENADKYPHYLRFANSNSCASYVGMQGGEQSIMVSDGCTLGSIVHEIGHALGLFHEHTRSDRDNFVQIDWSQIIEGKDINFNLQNAGTDDLGEYDYGSIMHYGEYFFSSTGAPTIIVPTGTEVGQRVALSDTDAASIDKMYETDLALLPPNDSVSGDNLEFGITVLNQGNLGAHQLELVLKLADDSIWKGVSSDSGWECLTYSSELHCSRPTLRELSESRFTVQVDPGSSTADELMMLLTSRTQDPAPDNNTYNNGGLLTTDTKASGAKRVPQVSSDQQIASDSPSALPAIAAAESEAGAGAGATSNDASSGGGSDNGSLLLLAAGLIGWRRYRAQPLQ